MYEMEKTNSDDFDELSDHKDWKGRELVARSRESAHPGDANQRIELSGNLPSNPPNPQRLPDSSHTNYSPPLPPPYAGYSNYAPSSAPATLASQLQPAQGSPVSANPLTSSLAPERRQYQDSAPLSYMQPYPQQNVGLQSPGFTYPSQYPPSMPQGYPIPARFIRNELIQLSRLLHFLTLVLVIASLWTLSLNWISVGFEGTDSLPVQGYWLVLSGLLGGTGMLLCLLPITGMALSLMSFIGIFKGAARGLSLASLWLAGLTTLPVLILLVAPKTAMESALNFILNNSPSDYQRWIHLLGGATVGMADVQLQYGYWLSFLAVASSIVIAIWNVRISTPSVRAV